MEFNMQRNDDTEQAVKTALLLGAINFLVTPAYGISTSVGILMSIGTNVFSIFKLHELGKERRIGANALTNIQSTFFSNTSSFFALFSYRNKISDSLKNEANNKEMDNASKNIINGGAAVVDKITDYVNALSSRK